MTDPTPAERVRAWLNESEKTFSTYRDTDHIYGIGPVNGVWHSLTRSDLAWTLDRLDALQEDLDRLKKE